MTSLLEIKNLSIEYKSIKDGKLFTVNAAHNVSLKINGIIRFTIGFTNVDVKLNISLNVPKNGCFVLTA